MYNANPLSLGAGTTRQRAELSLSIIIKCSSLSFPFLSVVIIAFLCFIQARLHPDLPMPVVLPQEKKLCVRLLLKANIASAHFLSNLDDQLPPPPPPPLSCSSGAMGEPRCARHVEKNAGRCRGSRCRRTQHKPTVLRLPETKSSAAGGRNV
jgi:hypothetical protein